MERSDSKIYEIGYKGLSDFADKNIATDMIEHEDKVKSQISDRRWENQLKQEKKKAR